MMLMRLIALALTIVGVVLMNARGGRWMGQVQAWVIVLAVFGLLAMALEYWVYDLRHLLVMYLGGAVVMAALAINAIGAFLRWRKLHGDR